MQAPGMMNEDTITVEGSSRSTSPSGKSECTMEETNGNPSLLRMPIEIIQQIGEYLEEKGDIAAFVRTCHLFNFMFGDVLYQRDQVHHKYKQDSCLTWAATHDRVDTLKRAIKAGIPLGDHPYLIYVVSSTGSPRCAELVLSTPGIDPIAEDERGWTPITLAASLGHANIVKMLVEHGASYTERNSNGDSPMTVACCRGSVGVVKLLVDEYGVSQNSVVGGMNWSVLRSAATFGHAGIVDFLLKRGADATPDPSGWSCLHSAAEGGHTETVNVLLNHGFNHSAVAEENAWTALTIAAHRGHYDTVELLLVRGVDIEQTGKNRWTCLCMAANRGDLRMAMLLIDRGANVMAKAFGGWSPIILAATNGHLDVVNLLIVHGADVHMKTRSGWTPLMAASDGGHSSLANILLMCGADVKDGSITGWNSLICAADGRHLQTAKLLLRHGANIMAITAAGYTPGIRAAYAGSYRLLNMFLKTPGFRLDHLDNLGRSAFFHAAMRGHTKVVEMLLPLTNTANARDRFGTTPIFAAARNGHRKTVELLINAGFADFAERDYLGCTLFAHAQRSGKKQFVKYLVRYTKQANIPIWLEDPAGQRMQHPWDQETCHCNVCGRASVHEQQAYVCDACNGGMVLCWECIAAGQTCNDISHRWNAHRCLWNDNFGWTPAVISADPDSRWVDDDGIALA
ncbi:ankyrin repeat-containing domain protein [Trichoderma pleuroticola]